MTKKISIEELKQKNGTEGLILQGCGGDMQEWLDGINKLFTDENILLDGSTFTDVSVFEHQGLTNLLFNMDGVKIDTGKLAVWRLNNRHIFGGTWFSDYLPNTLGVEWGKTKQTNAKIKPDCPLIGADGNIFNIAGIASRTLKENGMQNEAKEMLKKVQSSGSYDAALGVIMEYVTPVAQGEVKQTGGMQMGGV